MFERPKSQDAAEYATAVLIIAIATAVFTGCWALVQHTLHPRPKWDKREIHKNINIKRKSYGR
jgi:hypothetical protein